MSTVTKKQAARLVWRSVSEARVRDWGTSGDLNRLINNETYWSRIRAGYNRLGWPGLLIWMISLGKFVPGRVTLEIVWFMHYRYEIKRCAYPESTDIGVWIWRRHWYIGPKTARRAKACPTHAKDAQNRRYLEKHRKQRVKSSNQSIRESTPWTSVHLVDRRFSPCVRSTRARR